MRIRLLLLLFSTTLLFSAIIPAQVGNKWYYKISNTNGKIYDYSDMYVRMQIDSIKEISSVGKSLFISFKDTLGNELPAGHPWIIDVFHPYSQTWTLTDSVLSGPKTFFDKKYTVSQSFIPYDSHNVNKVDICYKLFNQELYLTQEYEQSWHGDPSQYDGNGQSYETAEGIGLISRKLWQTGMKFSQFQSCNLFAVEFNGVYSPVSIKDDAIEMFRLNLCLTNYPNPFNPSTMIQFSLATPAMTELKVYNSRGEVVKTLLKGLCNAGNQQVQFDGSSLASGVYYYRLTTPEQSLSGKMMLIK